jgi:nucleotide-binding universal stress UspA family protein
MRLGWRTALGGQLYIVHVSEREQYPVGEHFNEEPEPNPQEIDQLNSVVPEDTTIRCEHRLLYGEPGSVETTKPAKVIVDFAEKENVSMIVIGTHGRSGFSHLLMGSVAEPVVRHAHCPVVTVRQSKKSQKTMDT